MDEDTMMYAIEAMVDKPIHELISKQFLMVSFNVMVVTQSGVHFPNEFSYSRFSIAHGIQEHVHTFLHMQGPPPGYLREALEHMDKYHKINYDGMPGAVQGEQNFATLLQTMVDMVTRHGLFDTIDDKRVIPIFALSDQMRQVQGCFKQLAKISGSEKLQNIVERNFVVLDVSRLHFWLCDKSGKFLPNRPYVVCDADLRYTHYDYEKKALCDYHEERQIIFCTFGVVMRTAYLMFDVLCRAYNVKSTERHCPDFGRKPLVKPDNYDSWVDVEAERKRLAFEAECLREAEKKMLAMNISRASSIGSDDICMRMPSRGRGRGIFSSRPSSVTTVSDSPGCDSRFGTNHEEPEMIDHVRRLNEYKPDDTATYANVTSTK